MARYVQHKSGIGEKWQICGEGGNTIKQELYFVAFRDGQLLQLPKSEYILCEPPKEWKDVTDIFDVNDLSFSCHIESSRFRLRKIPIIDGDRKYSFIVESHD